MSQLLDGMPMQFFLPIIAINVILVVIALIDCMRSEATNGPKWLWCLVIIFINLLGPVLYFVIGRRNTR